MLLPPVAVAVDLPLQLDRLLCPVVVVVAVGGCGSFVEAVQVELALQQQPLPVVAQAAAVVQEGG